MNLKNNSPKRPTNAGIAGQVRRIREVGAGIQAEVCIGASPRTYVWVQVTSDSPAVRSAVTALQEALRADADLDLKAAQDDTERRGGTPVGRR